MRKYMLFDPAGGSPWEYPAIEKSELIIPLDKIVYVTSKYSLLKGNTPFRTSSHASNLTIVESPFRNSIYLAYNSNALEGIPTKLIRMKIIRQSKDKVELIGVEPNLDMSYSDYGITIKLSFKKINQIVFHNFEKELDYEFDGTISNKTNYSKFDLKKDFPPHLENAVTGFQRDKYKPLLEYLLAKYPNYYKIHYIIGVLVRKVNYFDEAIRLNKKYADAYDFKLALLKGEGVEGERYSTLNSIVKYKNHLSSAAKFFLPNRYLELAELEKRFGNDKNTWKYLSKYFSLSRTHVSDAYYLRATLFFEKKKYDKALADINESLKEQKNKNKYLLRSKIKSALGDREGSKKDEEEASKIDKDQSDVEVWF